MANKLAVTTPIGTLMYVMVNGQGKENYEGTGYDYQACVDIPEGKECDDFIDLLEDFLEDNAPRNGVRAGKIYTTSDDEKTDVPEGYVRFSFKTNVEFTNRRGEVKDTIVDILNTAGQKVNLPEGKLIGNGSTGRVIGQVVVWERGSNKKLEYGLGLYLNKVQIKDFVPYEGVKVDAIENGSFSGFDDDLEVAEEDNTQQDRSNRRSRRDRTSRR